VTAQQSDSQVEVPTAGTGRRFQRRYEAAARRRQRRRMIVAGVILVASLLGLGLVIANAVLDSDDGGGESPVDDVVAQSTANGDANPKALILHVSGGELLGATALVLGPDGGGAVVFLPVSTLVDIPGFNLDPLSVAQERGGADLSQLAVENLLGIEFDLRAVLDDRSFGRLVEDYGSLDVENPAPVEVRESDDRVNVLFPAGTIALEADQVGAFLSTPSVGEPELRRLVRADALWKSLLVAEAKVDRPAGDPTVDLVAFLHQLSEGDLRTDLLPVETLSGAGVDTLYRVDTEAVSALVGEIAPESAGVARIRVQVLNGEGTPGLAQRVAQLLVPAGARVDLTDNARTFDVETTQILFYRDEHRADAETVRDVLGLGEVVKDRNTSDAIDVTVVVGSDFVDRYGDDDPEVEPAPATTAATDRAE
jgi:LytR cell envelope-related transcriptional attenuator